MSHDIRAMVYHRAKAEEIFRARQYDRPVTTTHVLARMILADLPREPDDVTAQRRAELERMR